MKIKEKIKEYCTNEGISINKIMLSGITKEGNSTFVKKMVIDLDSPNDDDVSRIMQVKQKLEMQQDINIINVYIGI